MHIDDCLSGLYESYPNTYSSASKHMKPYCKGLYLRVCYYFFNMIKVQNIVYSFIIIVFWGINPLLTRIGSDLITIKPYMIITSILSTGGTMILNSIVEPSLWNTLVEKMTFHVFSIAFIDGIFCLAVPFFLYNILLSESDNIGVVVTTTWCGAPIFTTVLNYLIFNIALSPIQIIGSILATAGILLMSIEF